MARYQQLIVIHFLLAAMLLAACGRSPVVREQTPGSIRTWEPDRDGQVTEHQGDFFDPAAIFLTWQSDPATTMTIDWHTTPEYHDRPVIFHYKKVGDREWIETIGNYRGFPHSDRRINRIELRRLEPATAYRFRFGEDSREYYFRTMPEDLNEPITFVTGGDTSHERHEMTEVAMTYDPDFILWGGDLAYANGDPERVDQWYGWFDGIKKHLISDDGRVVPVVVAIGNHELFGERRISELSEEEALEYMRKHNVWNDKPTYFFDLFAFPGRQEMAYGVLDFSNYMSLILLDSDHSSSVSGNQTGWLESVLSERTGIPHIFPVYHVPAYPSHRPYSGGTQTRIREHWVPLFENYGVRVAFENHDHTYKRTHPILNGEIHENGIVYMGDGSWGRNPRVGDSREEWYINRFESIVHGIVVTVSNDKQEYTMVDDKGNVFDSYTINLILPP